MRPKRVALLRPLAYDWLRGPATQDRDQIVIDGRKAERYDPLTLQQNVGIRLAGVRTPADAVIFATAFGLPTPTASGHFDPFDLKSVPPVTFSQSWADFERDASDLRRTFHTISDVRAAAKGDRAALARIRADFGPPDPEADVRIETKAGPIIRKARDVYADRPPDDRGILLRASAWVAQHLSTKLLNVRAYVFEPEQLFPSGKRAPGQIRVGWIGPTLLDYCYLALAQALATEPVALCDECHRPYVVRDNRQRFCDSTCANRARFRKFKEKRALTLASTTRRSNGKRTTKR